MGCFSSKPRPMHDYKGAQPYHNQPQYPIPGTVYTSAYNQPQYPIPGTVYTSAYNQPQYHSTQPGFYRQVYNQQTGQVQAVRVARPGYQPGGYGWHMGHSGSAGIGTGGMMMGSGDDGTGGHMSYTGGDGGGFSSSNGGGCSSGGGGGGGGGD
ncbi:hypothetical protein CC80DRAFT_488856 [Byssothecium circinans]|uniref:Uncharacterized protein n=1 Tax=Byssothecium circinans TaxID=147558 RepID=A0A6A5UHI5_9PLEO|nr:hypothetical protein CC80DRAFT_488856 [Byssothecium circinans]